MKKIIICTAKKYKLPEVIIQTGMIIKLETILKNYYSKY